jgi:3-oxoacyl-[acyl-carrier protein] reductase
MLGNRNLKGKVAIITGASRGIGRVIAARVAQAGAQTVLVARSWSDLRSVADEILATSPSAPNPHMIEADLRNEQDIRSVIRGTVERFDAFQILVNNAADFARAPVAELPSEDWDRVMETNLRATYLMCHYAAPHFMRQGAGDIVNICSTSGRKGDPGGAAYAASKFGMVGLSQSLFGELRNHGVRVSVIYPSAVDTNERELSATAERPDQLCSEDIGDAVAFSLLMPQGVTVKEIELWNTGTKR